MHQERKPEYGEVIGCGPTQESKGITPIFLKFGERTTMPVYLIEILKLVVLTLGVSRYHGFITIIQHPRSSYEPMVT